MKPSFQESIYLFHSYKAKTFKEKQGKICSVEIYQLKVFLEVARHLSFTEAADALNLTQPAVSAKIRALESELETALFHRLGRKVKLTKVGEYLAEAGLNLIELEAQLLEEINEIKQGKFSRLRIGCTTGIADGWLPKLLFEYRRQYSNVQTQCLRFNTVKELYRAITSHEIEIGISENELQDFEEISAFSVGSVQYSLVVAADHPLAKSHWLSLRDLQSEAWVFPALGTPERLALDARLSELEISFSQFTYREIVDAPSLMTTYLLQGHYLGFASSLQFKTELQAGLLVAIPLQEFALASKLFMLMPKKLAQFPQLHNNHSPQAEAKEPIQQFIKIVRQQTQPCQSLNSTASQRSATTSIPIVHLRSPSLLIRASSTHPETFTIAIGTQNKTIQTATAGLIIQKLGLLEHFLSHTRKYSSTQYKIKWCDFLSGAPIVAGLQSQQLDIGILGDYPLLLSGATQTEGSSLAKTRLISFIAINPDGTGNTIIVPHRSHLTCLEDLRGRAIAVPFASAAHGMIMRSLFRKNLLHDVSLISIDNLNTHRIVQQSNQADGYAYFAPFHEIASHNGRFRRLLEHDLTKLPTFHGVVARETFADEHPDIVIAYLKALLAAQHWYVTTPSSLSLVSDWVRLDPEIVAKTLDYHRHETSGLFLPETQIRADWVAEHIQQLVHIPGNEHLGEIDLTHWIQPDLLQSALVSVK